MISFANINVNRQFVSSIVSIRVDFESHRMDRNHIVVAGLGVVSTGSGLGTAELAQLLS